MPTARAPVNRILVLAAVLVVAFAARWVSLDTLSGDDHYTLWKAATFLQGDRPFRDFVDLGDPLYWGMTVIGQAITGYRVIGEVVLGVALEALAFTFAFALAWRATGSLAAAAVLTALVLLVARRELYSYPKLFLYPVGLWLCWRYIDRPTLGRAIALACGVAVAFGYRHDHGAYIGAGAAAACLAVHWSEGPRSVLAAWLRFGIALLVFLLPYLVLVQAYEGVFGYFRERIRMARAIDATSRRPVWFNVDAAAPGHWLTIDPQPPARVFVEWKTDISPEARKALEQQYSLTHGVDPKRSMYEYLLSDISRGTLAALAGDSSIVEMSGLAVAYRSERDGSKTIENVVASEGPPGDAPPAARARVEIQWSQALGEEERAGLERQYGLLDYRSKWEYALTDVTGDNIRAIVEDSRVFDTGLIERDTYRPMEESPLVRAQRALPLLRVSVTPRYWHRDNAGVLLHFVSTTLPYIAFLMLAVDWIRGRRRGRMTKAPEKLFATAVMMAVVCSALLRREGYFADHVGATAVLGAAVLGHFLGRAGERQSRAAGVVPRVLAGAVIIVSFCAGITYVNLAGSLVRMDTGLGGVWRKSVRAYQTYSTSPPIDAYAPKGVTGDRALIRYVYECTRPDDRVWILSDLFTFPYYTERRVVRHIYWRAGLLTSPDEQRKAIQQVESARVPMILSVGGSAPLENLKAYPLVHDYVRQRYTGHYSIPEEGMRRGAFWLLTDSRHTPTSTYEPLGLPCFK